MDTVGAARLVSSLRAGDAKAVADQLSTELTDAALVHLALEIVQRVHTRHRDRVRSLAESTWQSLNGILRALATDRASRSVVDQDAFNRLGRVSELGR